MNLRNTSAGIGISHFHLRRLKTTPKLKMIITLLTVMICTGNVMAQFNKGRMLVGGTASFSSLTTKDDAYNSNITNDMFTLTPQAGYFVIDNLAVGLDASFGLGKSTTSSGTTKYTYILAGPFVRYYLKPGIFFQGEYQFGSEKYTISFPPYLNQTGTETLSAWALSLGYALFLNEHVAIEPMVSYKSSIAKETDYKGTNAGIAIGVGLQIYLGRNSQ